MINWDYLRIQNENYSECNAHPACQDCCPEVCISQRGENAGKMRSISSTVDKHLQFSSILTGSIPTAQSHIAVCLVLLYCGALLGNI